jgi:two-component system cell cycle response regulator
MIMTLPGETMSNTALIIGETPEAREAVAEVVESTCLFQRRLYCADSRRALRWLQDNPVDMVCFDLTKLSVRDLDSLLQIMNDEPEWRDIPVVVFSQASERELLISALETGASDGMTFETIMEEIAAKVRWHLKNRQRIQGLCMSRSQLARMALCDGLTGLYNRAYFDATLEKEMARSRRSQKPLSLLLVDLDHFKKINDSRGHLVGDRVLAKVAAALREQSRVTDTVCRYGGEEFAIILPETPPAGAELVAERIRRQVAALKLEVPVSVSIGVNCAEQVDDLIPDFLIAGADAALYAAKRNGRNRVEVAENLQGEFCELQMFYPSLAVASA